MTYSYDITTIVGQIRLLIGDTNIVPITNAVFTDEELTFFYTQAGSDIYIAAALACLAWANKYQANADSEHIGDYSYTQSIIDKLKGMAATFMSTSSNIPVMDWASFNMTGVENTEDI